MSLISIKSPAGKLIKANHNVAPINQSPKQDRDEDEVYLKTSPSQSSLLLQ